MEDQKTYQRAVGATLLGLGVQLAVCITLLILWKWSADSPVMGAALRHAVGGLGIWVVLWFLYMQHRLERLQAIEGGQLSQRQGVDTAIFETTADDLAVQRKRLQWLYRWVVPVMSLLTSGYLFWMAWGLLEEAVKVREMVVIPQDKALTLMSATAGVAFIGFLVSRYLAGMSRIAQWSLLRSGASYLMGCVLISTLLSVGTLLWSFDFQWLFRWMLFVIPVFMLLIGLEIVLNFILNLYRPRKHGEMPRPAFDSRLLSFLTTPESIAKSINEAINYQFGFEITKSWFWELFSRWFPRLVVIGVAVTVLVSSVVIVDPGRVALVTRYGSVEEREPLGQGLHLKLPWPVERVLYFDTESTRVITIGRADSVDEQRKYQREDKAPMSPNREVVLWSARHTENELDMIVAPPREGEIPVEEPTEEPGEGAAAGDASTAKAPPISLVNAEITVTYKLRAESLLTYIKSHADAEAVEEMHVRARRVRAAWSDAQKLRHKYDPQPNEHVALLRNMAIGHVTRQLLRKTIDEWIGEGSLTMSPELLAVIRKDAEALGVDVLDVSIAGIHPPHLVADAFHEVINAQQQRETTIENAQREAIRIKTEAAGSVEMAELIHNEITQQEEQLRGGAAGGAEVEQMSRRIEDLLRGAGGQTAVIISSARARRWELENLEFGRAQAFEAQLEAYRTSPSFYLTRKYLREAAKGLADSSKIIIAADGSPLTIRGNYQDVATTFTVSAPEER